MFKSIRKMMGSWPSTAQDFMERGWQLESEGKTDEAIADFTQAIEIEESGSRNLYKLLNYYTCRAQTSLEAGRHEQTRDDSDTLLQMLDEYYETIFDKSKYRNQCKDSQVADTLYTRAKAMLGLGNREQALRDLNRSIEAHGDEPIDFAGSYHDTLQKRAELLFDQGDLDGAMADCQLAIELAGYFDEWMEPAFRVRSKVYRAKGDHENAAKDEATADALARGEEWDAEQKPTFDPSADPTSQPTSSIIEVERFGDGELTLKIPPAGLIRGSKGLFVVGIGWTAISLVVGALVMMGAVSGGKVSEFLFVGGFFSIFVTIGIALTLGGYNMGTRQAAFAVFGGELSVMRKGIFGTKTYKWPVSQIQSIHVGSSGMTVNDVPVMQLSIATNDDELGMLSGRDDKELAWIADELNRAIHAARKSG